MKNDKMLKGPLVVGPAGLGDEPLRVRGMYGRMLS